MNNKILNIFNQLIQQQHQDSNYFTKKTFYLQIENKLLDNFIKRLVLNSFFSIIVITESVSYVIGIYHMKQVCISEFIQFSFFNVTMRSLIDKLSGLVVTEIVFCYDINDLHDD